MREYWNDAKIKILMKITFAVESVNRSLVRSVRFAQVVPPHWCVRVTREIE